MKIDGELKSLDIMGEKEKKVTLEKNNLRAWVHKNVKKITAVTGKKVDINTERDLKAISQAFIAYLKYIDEELTDIAKK